MNLNGPGASLFQGNELSDFDNLAQREEEEEEALEDQRRRDLELKNMLENAFDDVSFENDEDSVCNGSTNNSIYHSNSGNEFVNNGIIKINCNELSNDFETNDPNNLIDGYNTSPIHSRASLKKRIDFNNDGENFSDQCRKKMQNGNLHDVVDASGGGTVQSHYNHCFQRSPMKEIPNGISNSVNNIKKAQITEEAFDSGEQLRILYDVRVREVHRLTEMIDSLRKEHDIAINKLKHQFALSQAEVERANISQTQLQNLLVTNKQELEKLEQQIINLKKENKELDTCKIELLNQIELNKLIISDLERKVLVLEKGNGNTSEAVQYEANMKALIDKHNFELMNCNFEQEKHRKQSEELLKENTELKVKINQISEMNDENIAKKSAIISRLSKQIDETQKQCENLMKTSTAEDLIRLQMEIKVLKEDKLFLTSKLESLEKENLKQGEEIKQYESLNTIASFTTLSCSKDLNGSDVNGKLSDELFRSLNIQKAKRQEIKNLQLQLDERNVKISLLEEGEKLLKYEISKLKDEVSIHLTNLKNFEEIISNKESENTKLQNELQNAREELDVTQKTFLEKISELENFIDVLKSNVATLEKEKTNARNNYSEEYMRFHNDGLQRAREETENFCKLEILKKDIENENLKKEIEEIKNLYVEVFSSKEALLKQIEKERNCSSRNSGVDVDEVKRLQKELEKSRHRILELDQTLKQQYEQEVDILNLDINQLNLQVEKLKKEKDREVTEKDKISIENELLKSEIEHITSEKNLLFLNYEKLQKKMEEAYLDRHVDQENGTEKIQGLKEKYELELKNLTDKYEAIIQKLKKEIEFTLKKGVKYESKFTSPQKCVTRNNECQWSPRAFENKSTSPKSKIITKDVCTSPISSTAGKDKLVRNISVSTDPEINTISRKEVIEIMERLGENHESEVRALENKYRGQLDKLDKKFLIEVDKAKDLIRIEFERIHATEMQRIEEKHRIELENRVEQEKKEVVADLITEWACEVQALKASNAEAQTEIERMKMKYKAAKSVALQYKTYFKSKTEFMKEEWKRIEDGYEQALKELEKNVHILVDVKEDEVKAKVDSITKIYEQKISKMKEKLMKCEGHIKFNKGMENRTKLTKIPERLGQLDVKGSLERLQLPDVNLCLSPSSLKEKKNKRVELNPGCKKKKGSDAEMFNGGKQSS